MENTNQPNQLNVEISEAKATIYIPSSLAFGKKGFLPQIKPNTNIVFDIEVRKLITEDRALEIVSENRRTRARG
jgi:FKBP-type peptidyl-prolyl cis-trans isomerase